MDRKGSLRIKYRRLHARRRSLVRQRRKALDRAYTLATSPEEWEAVSAAFKRKAKLFTDIIEVDLALGHTLSSYRRLAIDAKREKTAREPR